MTYILGHYDGVVGFDEDILIKIFALGKFFVVDGDYYPLAFLTTNEDDLFFGGPFGEATGQGKGLQHGEFFDQRIFASPNDLSKHIKSFASRIEHGDGHFRHADAVDLVLAGGLDAGHVGGGAGGDP